MTNLIAALHAAVAAAQEAHRDAPAPTPDLPKLIDVAKDAGVTYRQADYWCRVGYVHAAFYGGKDGTTDLASQRGGSGTVRRLTPAEADVLTVMARLVHANIPLDTAAAIARTQSETGRTDHTLADGIYLIVTDPADPAPHVVLVTDEDPADRTYTFDDEPEYLLDEYAIGDGEFEPPGRPIATLNTSGLT